jgi:hypothetical protein
MVPMETLVQLLEVTALQILAAAVVVDMAEPLAEMVVLVL